VEAIGKGVYYIKTKLIITSRR